MNHYLATLVLVVALALCVYLLTILWRIHHVHSSAAWKFIFAGLSLLAVECAIGLHLIVVNQHELGLEETIFIATMMLKAICYAIGFTIWRRDIDWLKILARQRREEVKQDDVPED